MHFMRARAGERVPAPFARPAQEREHAARNNFFSCESIESLAGEWDALARRVGAPPYIRPGWIAAWWRAFGAGRLEIRTLRRDGRLAALLPVARRRGALRSVTNFHTPQYGLLAEDRSAANELARSLFVEKPRRVSIASLDPGDTSMQACQRAAEETGYRFAVRPFQRSPYLRIEGDWTGYESRLSRSLLADVRKSWRRLSRLGRVSVEVADGRERLEALLREAFGVEASGWKGARRMAIQSRPDTECFYTDVARWAAAENTLRLFFLRLDRRPLAFFYALEENGFCHLLKGGYDPAHRGFSPGKLLMHAVIRHGFDAGLTRIEFHGDAEPYKLLWADGVHEQKRFEAFPRSPAGQLAWAALAYGRPAAKRVLGHLGIGRWART